MKKLNTPEEWREAMRRCRICADALSSESRISDIYNGYRDGTVREELEKYIARFGQDCVAQVLSDTIKSGADWDRRYDPAIIVWAKSKPNFPPFPGKGYGPDGPHRFCTNLHPEYVRISAYRLDALEREQALQAQQNRSRRKKQEER